MRINEKTVYKLIERYGYSFYIIRRIPNQKCSCVNKLTNEPNPECKECLGLGTKINISRVFGVLRETNEYEATKAENTSSTPKICYIKGIIYVKKDDIIVDSEDAYRVYAAPQFHRGEQGVCEFTRCVCPYFKYNRISFIKNFKELLNEHYLRNN